MFTTQKKSLKVGKQVNTAHVNTVIRNYKQERWIHNSNRIGKADSLSVWYSIEELEEFLAKAKDHGADGVRLYFGAYDKDYQENPAYSGRQTIVFVATKQKENEDGTEARKDVYINTENGNTSILAYNAGSICPPFCNQGDGGPGGGGFDIGITIIDKGKDGMILA